MTFWFWILACSVLAAIALYWIIHYWRVVPLQVELRHLWESLEGERDTLQLVASAITSSEPNPINSLGAILSIVAKAVEADICAFLLYEESAGELVVQPGAYGLGDGAEFIYRMPLNNPASSSVRVFLTGVPFLSGDAMNDPQVISAYAKRWNCRSLIVVPLTLEGKRVGVLRVGKSQRDFFTQQHLKLVALIAEEAAVLLGNVLLERKMAEANQRLSQVNRMKDDIVSTVSHEFKTPLTTIKGFVSLLLARDVGPLGADQEKFLRIIESAADRLHALVMDLLDLSRLEGGGVKMEFKPVAVDALVAQCRQEHVPQALQRGIEMEVAIPSNLPPVRGDSRWLRQALDNLLSNAIKFTQAGGRVEISAKDQGEMVRLTVEDNGIGISPEDQERIFERFYRAYHRNDLNTPGTGLGLAIVKFIVDKHEGKVWVESEVGKGSRFHCVLPVARERTPNESKKVRSALT